uniref:HSF-type DNA-binding domain-containing protein n=1 Tax=Electrophorus electricus TaxID=8005 RepID=A0AAY5EDQ6_ELEEL
MERNAHTMASHGERETDVCHGAETSATQGTASRKRTFSRSASPCTPSIHNIDEASDGEIRTYLEEKAFQVLAQKSVIKKPRVEVLGDGEAPFELNVAALSFPRKLWHIVENETYKSIGWDAQGMCVLIDAELFVNEILRKEGDSKIFLTTNMNNFLRQLNLYGFKKMGRVKPSSRQKTCHFLIFPQKLVFHNSSFCRGHPGLLDHMKRRTKVRSELASGSRHSASVCTSQSLLPLQSSNGEISLDTCDAPLDLSLKNKKSRTSSSSSEASMNSTLLRVLSLLTEMTCLAQASTAESLIPARLQATLAAWISLSTPELQASGLISTSHPAFSALAQPCPNCGHNLLPSQSTQE